MISPPENGALSSHPASRHLHLHLHLHLYLYLHLYLGPTRNAARCIAGSFNIERRVPIDPRTVKMREKVVYYRDPRTIEYPEAHWQLLAALRADARPILDIVPQPAYVYGSVARGDVHNASDIDIIILDPLPSYLVAGALERAGYSPMHRELVQACPNTVPKAHIHLDERTTVTFPLLRMTEAEEEFYRFGGMLDHDAVTASTRVPGVNKQLLLIEPIPSGHVESSVVDREVAVARRLSLSLTIVEERVRVLTRRDSVGRTGVYLSETLTEGESFEERLRYLRDRDPSVRRQYNYRT